MVSGYINGVLECKNIFSSLYWFFRKSSNLYTCINKIKTEIVQLYTHHQIKLV